MIATIKEYSVVDIETTGLSRKMHKITEIAAVKVRNGKIAGRFQSLVNPRVHIPLFITSLTGIDDEMVKDADPIEKVLPKFLDFMEGGVFVAHSATFDYGFINHNAEQHLGLSLSNERLCTRKLANRLLPGLSSKKLGVICEHLGIVNEQAHRAMGDVDATVKVFSHFLELMKEEGLRTEKDIFRFEKSPIRKKRLWEKSGIGSSAGSD